MTPRKAKRTERKPRINWQERCMDAELDAETSGEQFLEMRAERDAAKISFAKRDIAIADLNAELREKDARIALLEHDRADLGTFMSDCQLVLATAPCTLCGAKWINANGLQQAFKRYADRTALPKPEGATLRSKVVGQ